MERIKRLYGIDALRGIAVGLMIIQHLGFWMWNVRGPLADNFREYPVFISLHGLCGSGIPIFLMIPGFGLAFMLSSKEKSGRRMVARGLSLMTIGYAMNLLVPSWFSPGSWYVLHELGFMMIVSSLLRKLSVRELGILMFLILTATFVMQTILDTPLAIGNSRMSNTSMPGGIFRLALVEGHFPIFPWAAYFVAGLMAGKWLLAGKRTMLLRFGAALLVLSAALSLMNYAGFGFAVDEKFVRAFKFLPRIYPSLLPISLFEISFGFFLISFVTFIEGKYGIRENNPLVSLGRISLTVFFLHVIIFKELSIRLGLWKKLDLAGTSAAIILVILFFAAVSVFWKRAGYKYSLEWLIRRIAG